MSKDLKHLVKQVKKLIKKGTKQELITNTKKLESLYYEHEENLGIDMSNNIYEVVQEAQFHIENM